MATRMLPSVPPFEIFNEAQDDWNAWSRRFDQWLLIHPEDISAERKRAFLCTYIGSNMFRACTLGVTAVCVRVILV